MIDSWFKHVSKREPFAIDFGEGVSKWRFLGHSLIFRLWGFNISLSHEILGFCPKYWILGEQNLDSAIKSAILGVVSPIIGWFHYYSGHFLDVKGNGEEGKVHRDLVFAEVTEASVVHIVFHLAENGLGLYASSTPVFASFFGCESFGSLSF